MPDTFDLPYLQNPPNQQSAWIHLSQYKVIEVTGPDTIAFLQGQCSNDFEELDINAYAHGAHCNVKGRMIISFVAYRPAEHTIWLRVHASVADKGINSLKKYAVFSKVQMRLNPDIEGLAIINAQEQLTAHVQAKAEHNNNCHEYWLTKSQISDITSTLKLPQTDINAWESSMVSLGIAEVTEFHSEHYLPQEFNLQELGGVSFKKGCYTGQEVIARVHYKGKLKKQLFLGLGAHQDHQELLDQETGKACGIIVKSSNNKDSPLFLALISPENLSKQICVADIAQPANIQWHSISYAITK